MMSISAQGFDHEMLAGDDYTASAKRAVCPPAGALCQGSHLNKAATIIRCVVIGLAAIWHMTVVVQGMNDMARMPLDTFR